MVYTIADAYNQSKNFDAGMQSLAETLYKYPILLESHRQPTSVDVLEPISWYNWSYHWISLKRNAANADSRSLMVRYLNFVVGNFCEAICHVMLGEVYYFDFNRSARRLWIT